MAGANINVTLSNLVLQVIDNTLAQSKVNDTIGTITLGAGVESYVDYFPVAAGAGSALVLPAATVWGVIVQSLAGVNGNPNGNITVQFQAAGGALNTAVNSFQLLPGGIFVYLNTTETAGGIVAVTLVSSVAATPVKYLLAA